MADEKRNSDQGMLTLCEALYVDVEGLRKHSESLINAVLPEGMEEADHKRLLIAGAICLQDVWDSGSDWTQREWKDDGTLRRTLIFGLLRYPSLLPVYRRSLNCLVQVSSIHQD